VYATCLFCHGSLGRNETIEHFPVGRRLAFDGAKGRLWVVCPRCARWNLSPLEERWEAIEECERAFRDTRLRASTDNVGLARVAEGLELVRIGAPQRPEFAAWRYGRQLSRRRLVGQLDLATERAARRVAPALAMGALLATPFAGFASYAALGAMVAGDWWWDRQRPLARLPHVAAFPSALVRMRHLPSLWLSVDDDGAGEPAGRRLTIETDIGRYVATGAEVDRALAVLLARVNRIGATRQQLETAIAKVDWLGGGEGVYRFAARRGSLPRGYEQRLALEMVSHEAAERRALEGELAELESAWREAEEVAAISDALFVPQRVLERIEQLQRGLTDRGRDRD
jgi:hypothetical protein